MTTVLKIMLDSKTPAGTQLRAAEVVLEQGMKAGEMEDIKNRVAKFEQMAGSAMKSPKRPADVTWLSATPLAGPSTTRAQIAAPPLDSAETAEDIAE